MLSVKLVIVMKSANDFQTRRGRVGRSVGRSGSMVLVGTREKLGNSRMIHTGTTNNPISFE